MKLCTLREKMFVYLQEITYVQSMKGTSHAHTNHIHGPVRRKTTLRQYLVRCYDSTPRGCLHGARQLVGTFYSTEFENICMIPLQTLTVVYLTTNITSCPSAQLQQSLPQASLPRAPGAKPLSWVQLCTANLMRLLPFIPIS